MHLDDYHGLMQALQDGRFDLSVDEADQLLRSLMAPLSSVLDGGGQILYHDWLAAVLDWREVFVLPEWPGWLRRAFEGFDTNGSGLLETHEVEALLCGEVCLVSRAIFCMLITPLKG